MQKRHKNITGYDCLFVAIMKRFVATYGDARDDNEPCETIN